MGDRGWGKHENIKDCLPDLWLRKSRVSTPLQREQHVQLHVVPFKIGEPFVHGFIYYFNSEEI